MVYESPQGARRTVECAEGVCACVARELGDACRHVAGLVDRLRAPGGCPWDRAQTHESLRPYALEEAREVVTAIEDGDRVALRDELGDLLLQVLLHSAIAAETGHFTLGDVLDGLADKLVRRHPHVFSPIPAPIPAPESPADVERLWTDIKAREAAPSAPRGTAAPGVGADWLAAVPRSLGALAEAQALGERASEVGFDWPEAEAAWPKVGEECGEFAEAWTRWRGCDDPDGVLRGTAESELGDVLLAVVQVARLLGLDAELALVSANARFRRRFGAVEARLGPGGARLRAAGLPAMEAAWQHAKSGEGPPPPR